MNVDNFLRVVSFDEVARKYSFDDRMLEIVKKLSPARFPQPGPHYDYADLLEHIRYAIWKIGMCSAERLLEYDLPEIYKRFSRLSSALSEGVRAGIITDEEYMYATRYLDNLREKFFKEWKELFEKCVKK